MTTCPVNHPRIWTAAAVAAIVVTGMVSGLYLFTTVDTHARFLLDNPTGYLSVAESGDMSEAELVFSREDVEFLSEASMGSLGYSYTAHERLFCLRLSGNEVVDVRLADTIEESDYHEVSGGCRDIRFTGDLGLAHTHPRYNDELSDTDKQVSDTFGVTCIVWDEVREIRGEVHGLRCFEVPDEDGGPEREFEELELAITE